MYVRIITNWRKPGSSTVEYKLLEVDVIEFINVCRQLDDFSAGVGARYAFHPLGRMFRTITMEEMRYLSYKTPDLARLPSSVNVYLLSISLIKPLVVPDFYEDVDLLKESIKEFLRAH